MENFDVKQWVAVKIDLAMRLYECDVAVAAGMLMEGLARSNAHFGKLSSEEAEAAYDEAEAIRHLAMLE